jgi:hypothetical protein
MADRTGSTLEALTSVAKQAREAAARGMGMLALAEEIENRIDAAAAGCTVEDVYRPPGTTRPNKAADERKAVARAVVSFRHALPEIRGASRDRRGMQMPPKPFPRQGFPPEDPTRALRSLGIRTKADLSAARSTVNGWRGVFLKLQDDFPEHSAAMLTTDAARTWEGSDQRQA